MIHLFTHFSGYKTDFFSQNNHENLYLYKTDLDFLFYFFFFWGGGGLRAGEESYLSTEFYKILEISDHS